MNDKIRRIETSLERDLKRLPQLYDEITRIVEKVHLLGIEVGAIKMAMKVSKGADDDGDKKTLRVLGIVLGFAGALMVFGTIGLNDVRPEQFTFAQFFEALTVMAGGIGIAVMAKKSYRY